MKKYYFYLLISIITSLYSCNNKEEDTTYSSTYSNEQKAISLAKAYQNNNSDAIKNFISDEKYIQHNLNYDEGKKSFLELIQSGTYIGSKAEIIRTFSDKEVIVLQMKYTWVFNEINLGEQAAFEIFRFKNGKAIEHWDNFQDVISPSVNGNTMFNGSILISDVNKTDANKTKIRNFTNDILINGSLENFYSYFQDSALIQHDPTLPNGANYLYQQIENLQNNELTLYNSLKYIYGKGNFVLTMCEGTNHYQTGDIKIAYYDLYRLQEGKIAEHWSVKEQITTPRTSDRSKW